MPINKGVLKNIYGGGGSPPPPSNINNTLPYNMCFFKLTVHINPSFSIIIHVLYNNRRAVELFDGFILSHETVRQLCMEYLLQAISDSKSFILSEHLP